MCLAERPTMRWLSVLSTFASASLFKSKAEHQQWVAHPR